MSCEQGRKERGLGPVSIPGQRRSTCGGMMKRSAHAPYSVGLSTPAHPALCTGAGFSGMCLQGSLAFPLLIGFSQGANTGWRMEGSGRQSSDNYLPSSLPARQGGIHSPNSLGGPISLEVLGTAPSHCPFRPRTDD